MLYIPSCELHLNDTLKHICNCPQSPKKGICMEIYADMFTVFFKQGLLLVTHLSMCAHVHTGK